MKHGTRVNGIDSVRVDAVQVSDRLRPVTEAGVTSLLASIQSLGGIQEPINVRRVRHRDNALVLITGAHRLEAVRLLGMETIPAVVWECNSAWAEILEIDDNLSGSSMTPLDTAVSLARRKAIYEREYPETKAGLAGARAKWQAETPKNYATDIMSAAQEIGKDTHNPLENIVSFVASTARAMDMSEKHVRRLVAVGESLDADDITFLRDAPRRVALNDLMVISKLGEPSRRKDVVGRLSRGDAKNAQEALRQMAAPTPIKQPETLALERLVNVWSAAPISAKRNFVEMYARDLRRLLDGGQGQ